MLSSYQPSSYLGFAKYHMSYVRKTINPSSPRQLLTPSRSAVEKEDACNIALEIWDLLAARAPISGHGPGPCPSHPKQLGEHQFRQVSALLEQLEQGLPFFKDYNPLDAERTLHTLELASRDDPRHNDCPLVARTRAIARYYRDTIIAAEPSPFAKAPAFPRYATRPRLPERTIARDAAVKSLSNPSSAPGPAQVASVNASQPPDRYKAYSNATTAASGNNAVKLVNAIHSNMKAKQLERTRPIPSPRQDPYTSREFTFNLRLESLREELTRTLQKRASAAKLETQDQVPADAPPPKAPSPLDTQQAPPASATADDSRVPSWYPARDVPARIPDRMDASAQTMPTAGLASLSVSSGALFSEHERWQQQPRRRLLGADSLFGGKIPTTGKEEKLDRAKSWLDALTTDSPETTRSVAVAAPHFPPVEELEKDTPQWRREQLALQEQQLTRQRRGQLLWEASASRQVEMLRVERQQAEERLRYEELLREHERELGRSRRIVQRANSVKMNSQCAIAKNQEHPKKDASKAVEIKAGEKAVPKEEPPLSKLEAPKDLFLENQKQNIDASKVNPKEEADPKKEELQDSVPPPVESKQPQTNASTVPVGNQNQKQQKKKDDIKPGQLEAALKFFFENQKTQKIDARKVNPKEEADPKKGGQQGSVPPPVEGKQLQTNASTVPVENQNRKKKKDTKDDAKKEEAPKNEQQQQQQERQTNDVSPPPVENQVIQNQSKDQTQNQKEQQKRKQQNDASELESEAEAETDKEWVMVEDEENDWEKITAPYIFYHAKAAVKSTRCMPVSKSDCI